MVALALLIVLGAIAGQLLRLALIGRGGHPHINGRADRRSVSRPDIVDRHGRIIATDVAAPSLYADPAIILDLDEVIEKLVQTLPGLSEADLRKSRLGDRNRRFTWIRRGLAPVEAQRVHELGLPGLGFRTRSVSIPPAPWRGTPSAR